MGERERAERESRYLVLLAHLLKWAYQPDGRGRSWENTIREQRRQIVKHLRANPSLKSPEPDEFADAYEGARLSASTGANLPLATFPADSPFTPEQAKSNDFWPE